ncbi:hypothetical protein JH06_5460 [Blastocystis sp. subtype 4]|uniref:hypothetical protein n=1 Tax=Blastocystis sp. subtype 4 TaxID=944170 RepID=UPI0007119293|nr:hypothetical protein JH06_5460 [Blastocystis sp. subtype 4]KNB41353.1 hypothetical protein JH06_5460 [Blastocystis sp. subtype 4]|eukprot:XP_014524796.1 hypothetical protein JH06_5460 [Blastocystis sp. subtype 4]
MTPEEKNIEMWRIKKLIKTLENAKGNGTSMISLIIRPGDQISNASNMLTGEYGTASNIKSRVNRLSVLGAITSTQQKLKLFTRVPPNGLVLYCGTCLNEDGKEKKMSYAFEPFRPINTSLYLCDNKFHTEALQELLQDDSTFGFVVMDGSGCLFGTVSGSSRNVLHRFLVDLPKKHGRGGQSALRFARLRLEKRHNYVRKCCELCVQFFIENEHVNVAGIVLAGSAELKDELYISDMLDPRIKNAVVKVVDVSYGGDNGFNQAIELSADTLANVKFVQEKKLISGYFDELARDTGKFCYGVNDTLKCLELGAVETLIVWENLSIMRVVVKNNQTGVQNTLYLTEEQCTDSTFFKDPATGIDLEVLQKDLFLEWLAENYKSFGATLEIITNKSQEGSQFVRGFGGIGGLLRWKIDMTEMGDDDDFM